MPMTTSVATANILYKLPRSSAEEALTTVLAAEPDLVGLQEWYVSRLGLLRRTGDVLVTPSYGALRVPARRTPRYHWVVTAGAGSAAGARADRFDLLEGRSVLLTGPGRAERPDRPWGLEPPRVAALGIFADRQVDRTVALLSFHLVSGAETAGSYRTDRPRLAARHRREVTRIEEVVAGLGREGHVVYAVGDANFHLLGLAGLTSAWEGREQDPGTIGPGRRKIDDVHGPGPATALRLIATPSDHRAVLVDRVD